MGRYRDKLPQSNSEWQVGIYIFTFILVLQGCSETPDRQPPETPSEVLNERVRSAPYQYINLDEAEVHHLDISQDDIIYSVTGDHADEEPLLGSLWDYTLVDDQFYAFDFSSRAVFRIGLDGVVEGPLTREGRGPGEHNTMGDLVSNSRYIYLPDPNNARVNRYSHQMNIVKPLPEFTGNLTIDLNEDHILSQNRNAWGFSPPRPEEGLIAILKIDDLTDTLTTIMPRIIPAGYEPLVYNDPLYSINAGNEIAASYSPLPWLFLYDKDFNLQKTLILEYSEFENMDIPAMDFYKPKGNKGFSGSIPIYPYKLFDDGDLFLVIQKRLIHLTEQDGTYQLKGLFAFHLGDEEERLNVGELFPAPGQHEIYVANRQYLFRVNLGE